MDAFFAVGRGARRPLARRQARDRGRDRSAGRRRLVHLRGPGLRRALGHAVGPGPSALPRGRLPRRAPQPLRGGERAAARDPARRDPGGRAASGSTRPSWTSSGACASSGCPTRIAHGLRGAGARRAVGLGCSVGIGRSKMVAKLASRAAKPTGQPQRPRAGARRVRRRAAERAGLSARPRRRGAVGGGARHGAAAPRSRRPHRRATWPHSRSTRWCAASGKASGAHLAALSRGEDPGPGRTRTGRAKSIGHEETFSEDLVDRHELERHVLRMAESVATMLRGAPPRPAPSRSRSSSRTSPCRPARTPSGVPSPRAAPSGRWPPRCWRASTPARASACSG